jgi:hypothetical protein
MFPATSVPQSLVDHVQHLGPFTVAYELQGRPQAGLPSHPATGRDYRTRIRGALAKLTADCRIGHLLVAGPEQVLLEALADTAAPPPPVTIWLDAGCATEVTASVSSNIPRGLDANAVMAPELPTPRGSCPALLTLGLHVSGLSYVAPAVRPLLSYFDSRVLGEVVLIDPTDGDPTAVPAGWPAIWTQKYFTHVYSSAPTDTQSGRRAS